MDYVGIKELKNQTTQILKAVREEGARYVVTYHGRPTAVILPLDGGVVEEAIDQAMEAAIDDLDEDNDLERELAALRKEIAAATLAKREREREGLHDLTVARRPPPSYEALDRALEEKEEEVIDEIDEAEEAERERKREELRQEIAAAWRTSLTAVEVISEQRR